MPISLFFSGKSPLSRERQGLNHTLSIRKKTLKIEVKFKDVFHKGKRLMKMPTISMFYGIIIRMYFVPGEHPPPHFHVYYNENRATVDIRNCEIMDGDIPSKQKKLVLA